MPDPYDIQNAELMDLSTPSSRRKKITVTVIILLLVVILAVTSALVVKFYVVTPYTVMGSSMLPTLNGGSGDSPGDILYLNKLAKIRRGDIVVCTPDWDALRDEHGNLRSIVKRVIGIGGDTVEVRDNKVYLNGTLLNEPYINNGEMHSPDGIWQVGNGEIFCMGDNRDDSYDSRNGGTIPLSCVVGRCFLIKSSSGKLRTP